MAFRKTIEQPIPLLETNLTAPILEQFGEEFVRIAQESVSFDAPYVECIGLSEKLLSTNTLIDNKIY
ncbi:hypothetical protein [Paenibacillus sp. O199]|uniref:hypothetical protein n=1 Tax=Paenibacillus sp. O199 TaxID=1643925 RepID=UPI0007BFD781|nr:hypothetical protein [Paenibacillus sp. O199]